MRILGFSGSLRQGSFNTGLLVAAAARVPEGCELVIYDGLRDLPFYDPALDEPGSVAPAAARLREAIGEANALLFAIPEYNGTIPAAAKNAVDWASRPAGDGVLKGIPAAVIGGSPGQFGGIWAQDELRKSLGIAGARVVKEGLAVPKIGTLVDDDGILTSETYLTKLDAVLATLVDEARLSAEIASAR